MRALVVSCAWVAIAGCASTGNTPVMISSKPMCMPCPIPCTPENSCAPAVAAAEPKPAPPPPAPVAAPPPVTTAAPTFSPAGGQLSGSERVTIEAPPGATVRYTTDGSEPGPNSPVYSGPIEISSTTNLKAVASMPGQTDSSVASATYEIAPPPPPPEPERVVVTPTKLELKDKIFFATGKAEIDPASYSLLDEVAAALKSHEEIKQVRVEGHTDNTGSAAFNKDLSQRRAEAVRDYLVSKGTEAERIDAKGYGPERPVAPNNTAKGREMNRRVEFNIPE